MATQQRPSRQPRIVALLSWWDENPAWLARTVASLGRFADHLVAVDGAYQHTPGSYDAPRSSGDQAEVIVAAADACGLGLTLHRPDGPWLGDEVEKRSFMFQAATLVAEPGVDWLVVVDADEVCVDAPADLRDQLADAATAGLEVATVELCELPERGSQLARRFFRADPTLRVEGAHFVYVAGSPGEPRYLWGAERVHDLEPAAALRGFRVEHWSRLRPRERRQVQLDYYERRDRYGLETTIRGESGKPPVYAFNPRDGSRELALIVSPEEYATVLERGYGLFDGQRATPVLEDCDPETGFLRLRLDEPYQTPVASS